MSRPTSRRFIGPLTLAQQRRRQRNQRRWDHISDVAYTFNCSKVEAMKKISDDRKYGMGRQYRLADYLTS